MKIKNSHTSKDMIKKVKTQSKEREKIFDNHVFDKDLACRIHNEFLQLNNVKDKHPIRKWEKDLNTFLEKIYKWLACTYKDAQHH